MQFSLELNVTLDGDVYKRTCMKSLNNFHAGLFVYLRLE